jgi:hypothetical protein
VPDRRKAERRSAVKPWQTDERTGPGRRISGIADRRREIHEDLAALYRRRCDDCTPTCVHAQDAAS